MPIRQDEFFQKSLSIKMQSIQIPSNLELLPNEIIEQILLTIDDLDSLAKACSTNIRLNEICSTDIFWKKKFVNDYGDIPLPPITTWKEKYQFIYSHRISSSISAGSKHFAVIDNTGILHMGGDNSMGQWGIGTTNSGNKLTNLSTKSPFQKRVLSVSCGEYFTGAITEDGRVHFWGTGLETMFGKGENIQLNPKEFPGVKDAIKIDCGPKIVHWGLSYDQCTIFSVILKDMSVYLWTETVGKNGQFREWSSIVSTVLPLKGIEVSTDSNNLAIVSTDGKLYYFGSSIDPDINAPDIGTPDINNLIGIDVVDNMVYVNPVHVPLPELIDQVTLSRDNIGVRAIAGEVYLWGSNYYGEVGVRFSEEYLDRDDGISESYVDNPEKFFLPNDEKFEERFSKVLSQRGTTSVITQDGKLYMWGSNNYYKFIDKSTINNNNKSTINNNNKFYNLIDRVDGTSIVPNPVQLLLGPGLPVKDIAVGKNYTIVLTDDGVINIIEGNK
jgi:alpha-tubulin suppressor-like RCC1 family protein